MEIAGFIKNSFVDYPGVISSVVFTPFCNFNCWYCHNCEVISQIKGTIPESEVFSFLEKRKGFIDGVVVSGGEPTLQKDLVSFIRKIKKMGFKVKLDTNGSNQKALETLVDENLLDYIAMDIKAPIDKYKQIIGKDFPKEAIISAIEYVKNCGVDHEFRTTFSPDLTKEDIADIATLVGKDHKFSLQQYNKNSENAPSPHTEEYIKQTGEMIKNKVQDLKIKGIKTIF